MKKQKDIVDIIARAYDREFRMTPEGRAANNYRNNWPFADPKPERPLPPPNTTPQSWWDDRDRIRLDYADFIAI